MQKEIRILSRGGQGAVTAAKILVSAAVAEGKFAQMVPNFGQERKGAPVFTFARISEEPILTHSYVYKPDIVILFDPSLSCLGINPAEGLGSESFLVINTTEGSPAFHFAKEFSIVGVLDAAALTREIVGDVPPNSALLGAFTKTTNLVGIESVERAILATMPKKHGEKNALCAREAFERTVLYETTR